MATGVQNLTLDLKVRERVVGDHGFHGGGPLQEFRHRGWRRSHEMELRIRQALHRAFRRAPGGGCVSSGERCPFKPEHWSILPQRPMQPSGRKTRLRDVDLALDSLVQGWAITCRPGQEKIL